MYKSLSADIEDLTKKGLVCLDPHCHTSLSDGNNTAEEMLVYAEKNNFKIIFTDHNNIRAIQKNPNKNLVPAVEVTSINFNDFLLYFYNLSELEEFFNSQVKENIIYNNGFNFNRTKLTEQDILLAKEKFNCKIVLPHPFTKKPKTSYNFFEENLSLLKKIDAVETHNSLMKKSINDISKNWAEKNNMPQTNGSDAHNLKVLGNSLVVMEDFSVDSFLDNINKKKKFLIKDLSRFDLFKSSISIFKNNLTLKIKHGFKFV